MTNKPPKKSWREIHLAVTAVAVTATLAFWNVFATPAKPQPVVQVTDTATPPPPPPDPTDTAQPAAAAQPTLSGLGLKPIKIIYGGLAPMQQVVQVSATSTPGSISVSAAAPAPVKKHKSGGGGGGGGGSAPAASSGSSKP